MTVVCFPLLCEWVHALLALRCSLCSLPAPFADPSMILLCICVQMLMDLGPVVYVEDFEKHFLAKAAEFYQVGHTACSVIECLTCACAY